MPCKLSLRIEHAGDTEGEIGEPFANALPFARVTIGW